MLFIQSFFKPGYFGPARPIFFNNEIFPNQVLHHFAKQFFAPLHVILNVDLLQNVNIYVVRDSMGPTQQLKVELKIFKWTSLSVVTHLSWDIKMVNIAAL